MTERGVNATIERLAAAIDELEVGVDRDELVAVHALADRLAAKVLGADVAFDAAEQWDESGATSLVRWLVTECRMSDAGARRQARAASHLAALPTVASLFEDGQLSGGQVELLTRWVRPRHLPLMAEHEQALAPTWAPLDVEGTVEVLRGWTERADALLDGPPPDQPERSALWLDPVLDRCSQLDAHLVGDDGSVVGEALRLARRRDDEGERRTRAERDADALVDICRRVLRDHEVPRTAPGRQRPGVNVVIDAPDLAADELRQLGITSVAGLDALLAESPTTAAQRAWYRAGLQRQHEPGGGRAQTLSGHDLSPALAAALCCDATMRRVLSAGSEILDHGRAAPTLPRSVREAVLLRDRRCRFRGCRRGIDWCEVHHVRRRSDGGTDAVANCVLLCARHHHVLHRAGWRCRLGPDGALEVTEPDGRCWRTRAPGPANRPPPVHHPGRGQPSGPDDPPLTFGA